MICFMIYDLVSLYNLDDCQDSSSFDDWHYSSSQQTLLKETSNVGFVMANTIVSQYLYVLEPTKPDDQNSAIKVLNAYYLELGYLDRSVATVLSLFD